MSSLNLKAAASISTQTQEASDNIYALSDTQKHHWIKHGYLHLTDFLSPEDKHNLSTWCSELESWPEAPGKWMKYFEQSTRSEQSTHKQSTYKQSTHNTKQLCRIENFLDYHESTNEFARGPRTIALLSTLMGEPATLFKEKINFKLPGGNGFTPHQDAPAFISFKQTYHITMMVAIDDATLENGCLHVDENWQRSNITFPQKPDGSLSETITQTLKWSPVVCRAGDVLLFDSYLPHYSESNLSQQSRRALFLTYNRLSEGGSKRDAYFKDKREKFPPDCERDPNKDYSDGATIYNVANPFSAKATN